MNHSMNKTSRWSVTLGFWSALLSAAAFLVFTVCFILSFATTPSYTWTDMAGYVSQIAGSSQIFKYVGQLMMLLFAPLYVLLLNSIYDLADPERKPLARAALFMGILFAACISMFYFVQLSAVRLGLMKGQIQGLEQFVQANPISALAAINILGWSLFFGLSSLLVAPVFGGSQLQKLIRLFFIVNGVCCLLGGVGYMTDRVVLVLLFIDFGMGGAVIVITIALSVLFKGLVRLSPNPLSLETP